MTGTPNPPTADSSDDFILKNGGSRSNAGKNEIHLKWTRFVKTNDTARDYAFSNSIINVAYVLIIPRAQQWCDTPRKEV